MTPCSKLALFLVLLGCSLVVAQDPYILQVMDSAISPGTEGEVSVVLTNNVGADIQGFNIDVCHEGAVLDPVSIAEGPAMQAMNGGQGPDFLQSYLDTPGPGVALGAIFSLAGLEVLSETSYAPFFEITYTAVGLAPQGTQLCFCDVPVCQGCPIASTVIVVGGQSIVPTFTCGTVIVGGGFLRGDCNSDGLIDIADPVFDLNFLFSFGPASTCLSAMDANDDDSLDLGDPIYLLTHHIGAGSPPPDPFPGCGPDPTIGATDCQAYTTCP
jgi:hypothetical protein